MTPSGDASMARNRSSFSWADMRTYLRLKARGFFKTRHVQHRLGQRPLQGVVLGLQLTDFVGGGVPPGIPYEAVLAGLQEVLGPAVIDGGGDAFAAAEFRHRDLAPQALQDDADLLFGPIRPPGGPPGLYVRPLLLAGVECLFFKRSRRRFRVLWTAVRLQATPV